jgi:hypothetical protein
MADAFGLTRPSVSARHSPTALGRLALHSSLLVSSRWVSDESAVTGPSDVLRIEVSFCDPSGSTHGGRDNIMVCRDGCEGINVG